MSNDVIRLNVGGWHLTSTRSTLTKYKGSVLERMFNQDSPMAPAKLLNGAYFIDDDPYVFSAILQWLRRGVIDAKISIDLLSNAACYYGLDSLMQQIEKEEEKKEAIDQSWHHRFQRMEAMMDDVAQIAKGVSASSTYHHYYSHNYYYYGHRSGAGSDSSFPSDGSSDNAASSDACRDRGARASNSGRGHGQFGGRGRMHGYAGVPEEGQDPFDGLERGRGRGRGHPVGRCHDHQGGSGRTGRGQGHPRGRGRGHAGGQRSGLNRGRAFGRGLVRGF